MMLKIKKIYLLLAAVLFVTIALYWQTLEHGFIYWDDQFQVVANSSIQDFDLARVLAKINVGMYSPLTSLTYALDYKLFGLDAGAFHASSLVYHLINAVLVFWLISLISKDQKVGLLVAAIFAIHPLNIESVAWISARSTLIYLMFFLASLIAMWQYWRERKFVWWLLSFSLFILACLAKATAIILSPILLLTYWYYYKQINRFIISSLWPFFTISFFFGLVVLFTRIISDHHVEPAYHYAASHWPFFIPFALSFYLVKGPIPFALCSFYPLPELKNNLLPWAFYVSGLIVPAAIALWIYGKKFRREIIFVALLYFCSLALVLKVSKIATLVAADRYYYLPGIILTTALVLIGKKLLDKFPDFKKVALIAIVAYLLLLAMISYFRIAVWHDDLSLATNVINQNGENLELALIYGNRGSLLLQQGEWQAAEQDLEQAIKLKPSEASSYDNLAIIKSEYRHDYLGSLENDNLAIAIKPTMALFYYNRGNTYLKLNKLREAIADFDQAISLDGYDWKRESNFQVVNAHYNRGLAYYNLGEYQKSVVDFEQVLKLNPEITSAHKYLDLGRSKIKK